MSMLSWIGGAFGEAATRLSIDEEIAIKPLPELPAPIVHLKPIVPHKPKLLTTAQMVQVFGKPGVTSNMIQVPCPYTLYIAWDLTPPIDTVKSVLAHKKVAPYLEGVMRDILSFYGATRIHELEIDQFGGMYNFRPQRGTEKKYKAAMEAKNYALAQTYLSRHSWATAWDLSPAKNALKTKKPYAQFSKPEYKALIDIHYANGFISYGIERNNDWMHFELGLII